MDISIIKFKTEEILQKPHIYIYIFNFKTSFKELTSVINLDYKSELKFTTEYS